MAEKVSIEQLLKTATEKLSQISESPKLDAEILLCHQLNCQRSYLYTWPEKILSQAEYDGFYQLLEDRLQGRPIAHITETREFWGLEFKVTPDTLIPRPDTETLVEAALEQLQSQASARILDLGTGTGAVALALKSERPVDQIIATDQSTAALRVAQYNSQTLHLDVEFRQGSWFDPIKEAETFHLIVSNPPYIEEQDPHLKQGDVRFEPLNALTSGKDGLQDIRIIAKQARKHLLTDGWLILEHGYNQSQAVQEILRQLGYQMIQTRQDFGHNDRITLGQKPA